MLLGPQQEQKNNLSWLHCVEYIDIIKYRVNHFNILNTVNPALNQNPIFIFVDPCNPNYGTYDPFSPFYVGRFFSWKIFCTFHANEYLTVSDRKFFAKQFLELAKEEIFNFTIYFFSVLISLVSRTFFIPFCKNSFFYETKRKQLHLCNFIRYKSDISYN